MSVYVDKKDGKMIAVHFHGDSLKEIMNIIDNMWCDLVHAEIKDSYAKQWPLGYSRIKELLKEPL